MKLGVSLNTTLRLVLLVASFTSLTYVAMASINYSRYYPAVESLNAEVQAVRVEQGGGSASLTVWSTFSITNPTDYSGLNVYAFDAVMYFSNIRSSPGEPNATIFKDPVYKFGLLTTGHTATVPLGPQSTVREDLPVTLSGTDVATFTNFNQTYAGRIQAHIALRVQVSSFLDSVTGHVTLEKSVDIPIT